MKSEFSKRLVSSSILVPFTLFFIIKGSFLFTLFICLCFLISSYEWYNMVRNKFILILGFLFLTFSFYSVCIIRNDLNENNLFNFLILIIICISTDLGGYIFGKTFKGPKLTKISPNKTFSGSVGSIILSSITFCSLLFLMTKNINFIIILTGIVTSLFCQIGDLYFSLLKRKAKKKDTGNLLPGHGGILDRIDGIIFGLPAGFIFLLIFLR